MSFDDAELLALPQSSVQVRVTHRRRPTLPGDPVLMPLLGEYRVYDGLVYDMLTRDEVRNRHYERAIRRRAPGVVALDIGTGRDVNWAHACIRAGARHVYALEELEASFEGARATIRSLGLEDRITLLRGNSRAVSLPERVDLCVSEIIGGIGSSEGAPAILRDARERLMSPEATMIPERCSVRVAAVELPKVLHAGPRFSYGWASYLDQAFAQIGYPFDIKVHIDNLPLNALLSTDDVFEDFDFSRDFSASSRRDVTLHITREGRLDGFVTRNLLWCIREDYPLDAFYDGGSFSPAPFFPVFYPGVLVKTGDVVEMVCESVPSDDGVLPDYRLTGRLLRSGVATPFEYEAAHHKPRFRTTEFYRDLFPV